MNKIYLLVFFMLMVGCTGSVNQAETAYKSELRELIPLKGHDPYEEGVLSDPYLKHRLTKMLGEGKYDTLQTLMHDCSPIGFNNDLLYWIGYDKHKPESNSAAIIIDLVNDEIYVGYEYGDAIGVFTDATVERENPTVLASWFNRRSRIVNLADSTANENSSTEN